MIDAVSKKEVSVLWLVPFYIVAVAGVFVFTSQSPSSAWIDISEKSILIKKIMLLSAYILVIIIPIGGYYKLYRVIVSINSLLLFLMFALMTAIFSDYPWKIVPYFIYNVGAAAAIALAAVYSMDRSEGVFWVIFWFAIATVAISIGVVWFFPERGIFGISEGYYGRWVGVTMHPNHLGSIGVISTWVGASILFLSERRKFKLVAVMLLIPTIVMLVGANSVTSMCVSAYVFMASMVFVRRGGGSGQSIVVKLCGLVVLSIVVIFIYLSFFDNYGSGEVFRAVGRDRTLSGRTTLWDFGVVAISEKPVFGWSFDGGLTLFSGEVRVPHFHNGFLDMAVRGGIVGFLLISFVIVRAFRAAFALKDRLFGVSMAYMVYLSGFLIHEMAEVRLGSPESPMWHTFLFVWMAAETQRRGFAGEGAQNDLAV